MVKQGSCSMLHACVTASPCKAMLLLSACERSHAIRLRSSTGLQASTRPARTIAPLQGACSLASEHRFAGVAKEYCLARQYRCASVEQCSTKPLLHFFRPSGGGAGNSGDMSPARATVSPCKGTLLPYRAIGVASPIGIQSASSGLTLNPFPRSGEGSYLHPSPASGRSDGESKHCFDGWRLAREPEKCTLAPVQLPNLG